MKKPALVFLVLAVLGAAIYGGTLDYPFQFDDAHTVVNNPNIRQPKNILGFFAKVGMEWGENRRTGSYRPFLFSTYAVNHLFSGLDPAAYRITNISLHVVNAFLVFLLLQIMLSAAGVRHWPWSALSAALFLVHPLQTEAVIYISGRSALLSATMCIACAIFYSRFRLTARWSWLTASALSFFLALLSKETALPFAAVIFVTELHYGRSDIPPERGFSWKAIAPFGAISIVYFPVRMYILSLGGLKYEAPGYVSHWMTEISVIPRYLKLVLFPRGLSVDHMVPEVTSPLNMSFLAGLLIIAIWAMLLVRFRRNTLCLVFLVWPAATLMTEMLLYIDDKMVDYRLYLPLAGLAGLAVLALQGAGAGSRAKKSFVLAVSLCVVLSLGYASFERSKVWADEVTLWRDANRKYPGLARPYNNLGVELGKRGQYAEARALLEKAVVLDPLSSDAHTNLGNVYAVTGNRSGEIAMYHKAIELDEQNGQAYYNLGLAYLESGRYQEAVENYLAMAAALPEGGNIRSMGASLLIKYGRSDLAGQLMPLP